MKVQGICFIMFMVAVVESLAVLMVMGSALAVGVITANELIIPTIALYIVTVGIILILGGKRGGV